MAFGLELAKKTKEFISDMVGKTAKALQLDHMMERKPQALSGGQRQRVALGRAIVRNPASATARDKPSDEVLSFVNTSVFST